MLYENQAVSRISDYPKYFFRYVSKERKTNKSVGPLINSNGELTNDNFEICQLLQQQYLSVFSEPSDSNYSGGKKNPDLPIKSTENLNMTCRHCKRLVTAPTDVALGLYSQLFEIALRILYIRCCELNYINF